MKKHYKGLIISVVAALSVASVAGISFADGSNITKIFNVEGKEYRAVAVDPGPAEKNAVTNKIDRSKVLDEKKVADDREKLKALITSSSPEEFAGVYADEAGNNVFLLTKKNQIVENKIKGDSSIPDKVRFLYVKYSEKELNAVHERLYKKEDLGIVSLATDIKTNKITIYIAEEDYKKNREVILQDLNEDIVEWEIGDFKMVDQAAILYPDEQIDRDRRTSPL